MLTAGSSERIAWVVEWAVGVTEDPRAPDIYTWKPGELAPAIVASSQSPDTYTESLSVLADRIAFSGGEDFEGMHVATLMK